MHCLLMWNGFQGNDAVFTTSSEKDAIRHRAIFKSAFDFIIIATDRQGLITDWNVGAESIFGWSAAEMVGGPADRIFTPEDRMTGRPAMEMQTALENGRATDERWHIKRDGTMFWASGQMTPLRDINGSHLGFLKIARDRTVERQADEWMSKDLERLRQMFEQAPGFIAILSTSDHVFDLVNSAYLQLIGHRDVVGKAARQALPDVEGQGFFEILDDVFASGRAFTGSGMELYIQRTPGAAPELRYIDLVYQPVRNFGGEVIGIFTQGADVTDRMLAEAAIRARDAQFEALAEAMPNHVWTSGPEGLLGWFNRQTYEYSGAGTGSLDGKGWVSLVHPEDVAEAEHRWEEALKAETVYETEFRLRRSDGAYRWHLARALPIRNESDDVIRWIGTNTDIEDQKETARALEHLNEMLEVRVRDRTEKLLQAEDALRQSQKMEAVGQLTGGVAHDFNNLLTIIGSSAQFLKRSGLSEERRLRYVTAIADTVDRASKLTGQLLAFARRQTLDPQVFDINRQIENVANLVRPLVGGRVDIALELSAGECFARADISQFETAIVNLAVNARDAMLGEGQLIIRVAAVNEVPAVRSHPALSGEFVAVSVADAGSGIAPDKLEQIFEPFYTTKDVGKGTGLGLSQVFGFAKQSGGEVTVESKLGAGATFTIYLPRARRDESTFEDLGPVPKTRDAGGGAHILVVEDNKAVGQFSTEALQDLGYSTTWACDASEALELLSREAPRFDLVFSDVVMPGMNGVELAHTIKGRYPKLPVVLTSGYSDTLADERAHGFELIKKPYSMEGLARALNKATLK